MNDKKRNYLLKHSKNNDLEYDFMPGLIEIIERPTNKGAIIIVWTSLLLVTSLLIWSYFGKAEVVNECRGVIASSKGIASMRSDYTGKIDKVYIEENDIIKKGQKIIDIVDDKQKFHEIYAQKSGTVTNMSDIIVGTSIQKNQELFKLIPNNAKNIVKIHIANMDVADVKAGSKVQVKIDAYPYGKYGMVNGTISKMGRVAEYDEQEGYYFPAEVELGSYDKQKIILMDGMTCNVEVNIGKRRIIEFVLEPIIEALRKSVKEK